MRLRGPACQDGSQAGAGSGLAGQSPDEYLGVNNTLLLFSLQGQVGGILASLFLSVHVLVFQSNNVCLYCTSLFPGYILRYWT